MRTHNIILSHKEISKLKRFSVNRNICTGNLEKFQIEINYSSITKRNYPLCTILPTSERIILILNTKLETF